MRDKSQVSLDSRGQCVLMDFFDTKLMKIEEKRGKEKKRKEKKRKEKKRKEKTRREVEVGEYHYVVKGARHGT